MSTDAISAVRSTLNLERRLLSLESLLLEQLERNAPRTSGFGGGGDGLGALLDQLLKTLESASKLVQSEARLLQQLGGAGEGNDAAAPSRRRPHDLRGLIDASMDLLRQLEPLLEALEGTDGEGGCSEDMPLAGTQQFTPPQEGVNALPDGGGRDSPNPYGCGQNPERGEQPLSGSSPRKGRKSPPPSPGAFSTEPQKGPLTEEQTKKTSTDVARRLMKDFGLTEEQAAGIVGNLYHESAGMNANINEFGSDPNSPTYGAPNNTQFGYGWAQWSGDRKQQFLDFCKQKGFDPASPEANYQFLKHELETTESKALEEIKKTHTAKDAAIAFDKYYERAANPLDEKRIAAAEKILGWLG